MAITSTAHAQNVSTNGTSSAVVQGEITIHTVTVGKVPNAYDPPSVLAVPGDIISFEFWASNHSVIRSAYGERSIEWANYSGRSGVRCSRPKLPDMRLTLYEPQTWNLTVNTTSPVWWYCGAPGSCIGHAMVGVINPDSNTSLNTQIELSGQANYMLEPGQAVPQDALQSMSSLAATATTATVTVSVTGSAATATPTTSSTVTPTPTVSATPSAPASPSSISPGAIAGIVVGGVVVLVAFAALLLKFCRTNTSKAERKRLRDSSAPQMRYNGEMAGFMTVHNGHYDGAQLPPYQSPVMRHPEFKEMADSRANEVPLGPNMRDGPSFSFGQNRDADQHRFSNTSELSGLQSPQELPTMHEIFTPGATNRNVPSPSFS
ncbi:hypothetical protein LTR91_023071 [Friedmanniomyces endolithicus]|uniref:Phytocyanin domain-containing protein n=1 Tax=Friedmanniomyces endolithicus TaxID=329885 RepID=A0AAN6H7C4_9PEZI|nr:hypothetical protein LTR75_016732 [Friedmanniomyces endolithicus]KAK0783476.1 hypothetical protein LTR59_011739 [Friedmanniomyces endolithicus]KAK0813558.1 hypothetical protein LTR38_002906 [Friedmanniomyces endolithicus]KAK0827214.1 hypothetical protein LTR03_016958 [Friedmanniomyces endolithicus]KAK0877139.1 hypothetical protein LTR87_009065 [Friedmanniomyces endolithicus]